MESSRRAREEEGDGVEHLGDFSRRKAELLGYRIERDPKKDEARGGRDTLGGLDRKAEPRAKRQEGKIGCLTGIRVRWTDEKKIVQEIECYGRGV
jgi:hypothetical protein